IMIDEIGKMECLSRRFQGMVKQLLDSERMIIATIAQYGGGLIAEIKSRKDVQIYALTPQNRDAMLGIISAQAENPRTKH
ncbi:MAG TPA: nucleoside-triphosphatase, partial [Desulfobacterales bacterium]|nr:nucleoside-triphosphatase [Desulfobacterales bacterium]